MTDLSIILKDLYDSEINVILESFWDAGWTVKFSIFANGVDDESNGLEVNEIAGEIILMTLKHFPDSKFSEKYKELTSSLTKQ